MKEVSYEEFMNDIPFGDVLLAIHADWCNPCQRLKVALSARGNNLPFHTYQSNVDENSEWVGEYSILTVPLIVAFRGGEFIESYDGDSSVDKVLEWAYKVFEYTT